MQPIIEAIILIIEKYVRDNEQNINGYVDANSVTLKFKKDGKIYKRLKIEQDEDKLKVTFIKENVIKFVDLEGLDNILEILEKECDKNAIGGENID